MSHPDYSAKGKRQNGGKIPTKIVVRRLPPNFTLETFKEHVSPLPDYNYFYFVKADKVDGSHSFSRAYINFIHYNDMFIFKEKYDTYVFLGPKGVEYPAVVEYAPFQKIPKDRFFQRRDVKCGTIQHSEHYLQFINAQTLSKCKCIERPEYDLRLNTNVNQTDDITPLLKYISAKKVDQSKSRLERKKETKSQKNENCMIFVNSSVRKNGNHRMPFKRNSTKL